MVKLNSIQLASVLAPQNPVKYVERIPNSPGPTDQKKIKISNIVLSTVQIILIHANFGNDFTIPHPERVGFQPLVPTEDSFSEQPSGAS